jgi:hypothetical protein
MTAKDHNDITGMLATERRQCGSAGPVIAVVCPELRWISRNHLARRRPGESPESAALANERICQPVEESTAPLITLILNWKPRG